MNSMVTAMMNGTASVGGFPANDKNDKNNSGKNMILSLYVCCIFFILFYFILIYFIHAICRHFYL
jgi:hypothetical protein